MQWYHYLNAAVVGGLVAYWLYSNRDQLSEEERKEYEAAMALHDEDDGQVIPLDEDDEAQEQQERDEAQGDAAQQVPRDPAAALAERQAQAENGEPVRLNSWKNREVGAKKAKSLALKAQRRNYFEYMEQQARARKEQEEMEEQMYGDINAEERAQRELRSEQARIKLEEQQRAKREAEEKERKAQAERKKEIEKSIETQGYAKVKSSDDQDLLAELGTLVDNGEYLMGGPKVLAAMEEVLKKGEASWGELVSI